MLRKAIVLGLAVAALPGTVAFGQEPPEQGKGGGPGPGFGHIYRQIQIESNPTGALIVIDGRRFDITPQVIRVDNDRRTIQVIISKPGYLAKGEELDLTSLTEPVTVIHEDLMPRY